jgi:hypothetical protein
MAFLGESEESILALNVPPTAGLYGGVGGSLLKKRIIAGMLI